MSEVPTTDDQHVSGISGISSPAFQGLLWTQALTAVNDNVFRWFVIGIGKTQFIPEDYPKLLAAGSAFFLVPYILFASVAGWLGDRFKKSHVILGCKFAEIVIMAIGVIAVGFLGDPNAAGMGAGFYVLLGAVFLMGTQSALFSPSKMGTIPELLTEEQISKGNGFFALTTLTATIVGTGIGGWLADVTIHSWMAGKNTTWLPAIVMVGIAVIGTSLAFLVRSLPAADPTAQFPVFLINQTWRDIVMLSKTGRLFRVAMGVVFFWSIAGLAQLNIDVFSEQSGGLLESHRTPLLVAVTLGIGVGSVFAGYISAGKIRLSLVPWAASGLALFCLLLYFSPADFITGMSFLENIRNPKMILVCLTLGALGFSAGVFDVPLAAYLQHYSPIEKRGSIIAATNCLAFVGILVLTGMFMLLQTPTRPGALENLPPELTSASLDAAEKVELGKIATHFGDVWDINDPDANKLAMKELVKEVPAAMRPATVSQLVMIDARNSADLGKSVAYQDYDKALPGYARQIKKVIVQTGTLPLMTSRQIFLFMGLLSIPVIFYSRHRVKVMAIEDAASQ